MHVAGAGDGHADQRPDVVNDNRVAGLEALILHGVRRQHGDGFVNDFAQY